MLTDKQERFCREYIIDNNATQAASRAGYSEKTANEQGSQLLSIAKVSDRIAQLKAELNAKLEDRYSVDKDKVLREFARLAFGDIRSLFKPDGSLKDMGELDDDTAALIHQVDIDEIFGVGTGAERTVIGNTRKVKVYDKLRALELICKVMGYNAPVKKDVKYNKGFLDFMKSATSRDEEAYEADDDDE